jgi:hypothetical protein
VQWSDQTLGEFVVLTLTGIIVSALSGLAVTDYRGLLTRYAHRCWLLYQRPWYRRTFVWGTRSGVFHSDEHQLRRTVRVVAVLGTAMGLLVIAVESIALVTGNVI